MGRVVGRSLLEKTKGKGRQGLVLIDKRRRRDCKGSSKSKGKGKEFRNR